MNGGRFVKGPGRLCTLSAAPLLSDHAGCIAALGCTAPTLPPFKQFDAVFAKARRRKRQRDFRPSRLQMVDDPGPPQRICDCSNRE